MNSILIVIFLAISVCWVLLYRIENCLDEANRLKKLELKRLGISEEEIEGE